jgi:hypothetical protein
MPHFLMRSFLVFLFCLYFYQFSLHAQTLSDYEKAAEEAFEKKDFFNALYFFEIVLKTKNSSTLLEKAADASRFSYNYKKAELYYREAIENKSESQDIFFKYGLALKHNAKYDEAKAAFNDQLRKKERLDSSLIIQINTEIKSCEWAKKAVTQPNDKIQIEILGDNINSEFSDFAPFVDDMGKFHFSSLKFQDKSDKKAGSKKDKISKILVSKNDQSKSTLWTFLSKSDFHYSGLMQDRLSKNWLCTQCEKVSKDSLFCKPVWIYTKNNKFHKQVDIQGLPNNFSHIHSHIYYWNDNRYLIFVSDMPGTLGKNDIWIARFLNDTTVADIQNAGSMVNGVANEASPFIDMKSNKLFFSSESHENLGGYDIFSSSFQKFLDFERPSNLGLPFNSAANDLYYYISPSDTVAYLSSNRVGSRVLTEESCCNDIYKLKWNQVSEKIITDSNDLVIVQKVEKSDKKIQKNTEDKPEQTKKQTDSKTKEIQQINMSFEEITQMLPIQLYFHNDEPDSNTTSFYTSNPYQKQFEYYTQLKQIYFETYASQFSNEVKMSLQKGFDSFFEKDVKGEFTRLQQFLQALKALMEKGYHLELQLKGFTSPRAQTQYNFALAQRRIHSVKNQIKLFEKGFFNKYIESRKLILFELPFGETKSPPYISDQFGDYKNSIYSVGASKERRVELVLLKIL